VGLNFTGETSRVAESQQFFTFYRGLCHGSTSRHGG